MDTIRTYLENVFKTLPRTEEFARLRQEMLSDMEEKYEELKAGGKSENEAVGIVISEFGSIDELEAELVTGRTDNIEADHTETAGTEPVKAPLAGAVQLTEYKTALNVLDLAGAVDYLRAEKLRARLTAAGVSLIMAGMIFMILLYHLLEYRDGPAFLRGNLRNGMPVVPLLLCVAAAVALFIYAGARAGEYAFIRRGEFMLKPPVRVALEREMREYRPRYTLALLTGVCLCILSPLWLLVGPAFIPDRDYVLSLCLLLGCVMAAVALFLGFGRVMESYRRLLGGREYGSAGEAGDRIPRIVAGVFFLLAFCVYMVWGFICMRWSVAWTVFPVTGMLYGVFVLTYNGVTGRR